MLSRRELVDAGMRIEDMMAGEDDRIVVRVCLMDDSMTLVEIQRGATVEHLRRESVTIGQSFGLNCSVEDTMLTCYAGYEERLCDKHTVGRVLRLTGQERTDLKLFRLKWRLTGPVDGESSLSSSLPLTKRIW